MKIEVGFPTLSNRISDIEVTGGIKRHGLSARKVKTIPTLSSKIMVTSIINSNNLDEYHQLHLKYEEAYNKGETFGSFMGRAKKYAEDIVSNIKTTR